MPPPEPSPSFLVLHTKPSRKILGLQKLMPDLGFFFFLSLIGKMKTRLGLKLKKNGEKYVVASQNTRFFSPLFYEKKMVLI